eukprot:2533135-Amphidinium_carterae.2
MDLSFLPEVQRWWAHPAISVFQDTMRLIEKSLPLAAVLENVVAFGEGGAHNAKTGLEMLGDKLKELGYSYIAKETCMSVFQASVRRRYPACCNFISTNCILAYSQNPASLHISNDIVICFVTTAEFLVPSAVLAD